VLELSENQHKILCFKIPGSSKYEVQDSV